MMHSKADLRIIIGGIGVFLVVGTLVLLILNLNAPVSVTQQTTAGVTSIVKSCNPIPNIPNNPLGTVCLASTTPSNVIPANTYCNNGGIPQNGICPNSVIPLPSNTTIANQPITIPVTNTEQIQLSSNVILTDNTGSTTTIQSNPIFLTLASLLPKLDFTAVSGSNSDISQGKINLSITLKASPNEQIIANGTMFVTINGQQLHPNGLQWAINGITGTDGKITANISTPLGVIPQYVLDISKNISSLTSSGNNINFTVSNLKVQNGIGKFYKNQNQQTIFSAILLHYGNAITFSNGKTPIINPIPIDDTFSIIANVASVQARYCANDVGGICVSSKYYPNPWVTYTTTQSSIPTGIAKVYLEQNGTESLIGTLNSITTGSQTLSNIPRNSDIRIITNGGSPDVNQIIHLGANQESHSYTCNYQGCILS